MATASKTEGEQDYLRAVLEKTRSRLLDQTRRNRLLNYKESARDVAFMDEMPDQVYEHLVLNNEEFYFDYFEEKSKEKKLQADLLGVESPEIPDRTLPRSVHKQSGTVKKYLDNRLQAVFSEKDLERRLRTLYLDHRTIIEETGANNLYLAIGFLEWYDSREERIALRSPLILVPVKLVRERRPGKTEYSIAFDDQPLDTNYSLYEKLKHDFEITLPTLEEDHFPEAYLRDVDRAIGTRQREGWQIVREMALGLFRFNKQVMWRDLDPNRWPSHSPLLDNKILRRILLGPQRGDSAPGQLTVEYSEDEIAKEGASGPRLIWDADSSQFSALVDALEREDGLVIEGPPGTGKSQTITNLIAAALDRGLSVLFVAEKMAALEVVFKRLEESKLGDFCLQLHGLRTSKKELLGSILQRVNRRRESTQNLAQQQRALQQAKNELIELSKALSEVAGPEGLSLYQIPWRLEKLRRVLPGNFEAVQLENPERIEFEPYQQTKNLLSDLGTEWGAIPEKARAAWRGFLPKVFKESQVVEITAHTENVLRTIDETSAWLGEHSADQNAPCLYEVHRLLTMAEHDPNAVMPALPAGTDPELAYKLAHDSLLPTFGELLSSLTSYVEDVYAVNKVFDYESEQADSYARSLRDHANTLANTACKRDVTVAALPKEQEWLGRVLDIIDSLPRFAATVIPLVQCSPQTLDDYRRLAVLAEELCRGPAELSLHAHGFHANPTAESYLEGAHRRFETLTSEASRLSVFRIDRARDTSAIRMAVETVKGYRDSWFPLFSSEYRRAKAVTKRLMKKPKAFSRRDIFLGVLQELADFCLARDEFVGDKNLQSSLGSLFKGMETDWKALREVVSFSNRLREQVGMEQARSVLSAWSSHVERMIRARDNVLRALGEIEEYAHAHPFPNYLWRRPTSDIVKTLAPWMTKLQVACDSISKPWCRGDATLQQALQAVEEYRIAKTREERIRGHKAFGPLLAKYWEGPKTNITLLRAIGDWFQERLSVPGVNLEILRWLIPTPAVYRREYFREISEAARQLGDAINKQVAELGRYGEIALLDWIGGAGASLEEYQNKLKDCLSTTSSLPLMARWQVIHRKVCDIGFKNFADQVSNGSLVGDACSKAFEYSLYHSLLEKKISSNRILETFGHSRWENLRARFVKLDKETLQLNAKGIAEAAHRLPVPEGVGYGPVKEYTDKRLLIHEAGKKQKHIPIRQLIRRAGSAVQALKPCFLMSPLSVAQYLAPGEIGFDLVVMDEASQLRPEDALGAIARGKRSIVVGDPKQLPPTSFFDTAVAEDEEAEETIVDDTESILDVCLKQLPYRRLRWHYRSQHESLIHFSNEKFYEGDLVVFPSPKGDSREYGVHLNYIENPSYRAGRNRAEAEVVVENIIRHFHRHKDKSLGVAAFNKRQAEEIELLLDRARIGDPAIEKLISEQAAGESLFIKNLENVQGDERDVIFISTTYGPEKAGAPVFQRFGPINSELGWRRLNVIATRARQRVEVFTSMKPTDVNLAGTPKRGVLALRDYLEYANTGRVPDRGGPTSRGAESEFEEVVGKLLGDLGYEFDPQVGVSGFYIDIGVRHPDRPGEYLLGVECDGAAYHHAMSVRDRDRLRQEILENKGWFIHRIWSTSWYHTRAAEVDRLKSVLTRRLEEDRSMWASLEDYSKEADILVSAQRSAIPDVVQEEQETKASLQEALERFWEKNIKANSPDRTNSILSEQMVRLLAARLPESKSDWYKVVPLDLRVKVNPAEMEYLSDVLDVIAEYV